MTDNTISEEDRLEAALEQDQAAKASPAKPETPAAPAKRGRPPGRLAKAIKEQDKTRRAAIAEAEANLPPERELSKEEKQNLERIEKLNLELSEIAKKMEKATEEIAEMRERTIEILAELRPQVGTSDRLSDAVSGYITASKADRETRASNPERLRAMLAKAGKAPIDAAFERARYRGGKRPTRTLKTGSE